MCKLTLPSLSHFLQLHRDMSFPGPAKMVQDSGYLKIELDDEYVTDLWSLCTSTWKVAVDK